uniref:glutathione S-transferase Mu 4-like isoform X2 n=1 Tax=Myxine glutinosa TaxID=7769 RepID=UPI00358E25C0
MALIDSHSPSVVFGYWDVRGLGQPIRLLLEHVSEKYEDKLYVCGDGPDYDRSCWLDEKFNLGLDFPNLPYIIDGSVKIVQSGAIMRYLGRKHDLCPDDEIGWQRVDQLEDHAYDLRIKFARTCYSPDFEKTHQAYTDALPGEMKQLSAFLGNRKWFVGDKLTFVDFIMYEYLDQQLLFSPSCLDNVPTLKQYHQHFEELKNIPAYLKSNRFIKTRINNRMAFWGSGN